MSAGSWVDDRETWYACLDRVVGSGFGVRLGVGYSDSSDGGGGGGGGSNGVGLGVDGEARWQSKAQSRAVVVKTSARVDWDAWRVAVNQTWACGDR